MGGTVREPEQHDREGVGIQQTAIPVDYNDPGRHLIEDLTGGQDGLRRFTGWPHARLTLPPSQPVSCHSRVTNTCAAISAASSAPVSAPLSALVTRTPLSLIARVTSRPGCIPMFLSLSINAASLWTCSLIRLTRTCSPAATSARVVASSGTPSSARPGMTFPCGQRTG